MDRRPSYGNRLVCHPECCRPYGPYKTKGEALFESRGGAARCLNDDNDIDKAALYDLIQEES